MRVCVGDRRHPTPAARVDPLYGRICGSYRYVTPCPRVRLREHLDCAVRMVDDSFPNVVPVVNAEIQVARQRRLTCLVGNKNAAALQTGATRCGMLGVFRYHRAGIIGLIASPGVCPLGAVGKGKRLLGDKPAGVRAKSSVLINITHATGGGVDGMRCPLDNSIEEIPAQCVWGAIPKGIIGWYGQVKLPKEAALIIARSEHLWSRHLKGRNLGICQIIADDRAKHIRTKWETSLEKDGTAG